MKARHLRVIRDIQDSIPSDLLMNLTMKEKQYGTLKQIVEVALTKPDTEVPAKQKRRMRALLDSGYLDKEIDVINTPVEKQIDEYITTKIAEAVRQGRLPKKAPTIQLLNNKGKQYARRQRERLRKLAMGDHNDVVHDSENNPEDQTEHTTRTVDGSVLQIPGGSPGQ